MTIIDFAAKRHARDRTSSVDGLAEYLAADELRKDINAVHSEHEARLKREQAQRAKV